MGEHPRLEEIRQAVFAYFSNPANSVLNLTEMVYNMMPSNFDTYQVTKSLAASLKETGKFIIETDGIADGTTYFLRAVEKKHWTVKKPFLFALVMAIIAGGVSWLVALTTNQAQDRQERLQEKNIDSLFEIQANYQTQLADSIAKLRAEMKRDTSK